MTKRVALFITCLADLFRPSVGFAAVKLLEDAGCKVEAPQAQTCCGQPAYNSGDLASSRALAKQLIAAFETYDHVVAPSGSCAGMIVRHYPSLMKDDPEWAGRAQALADKTHELTSFLVDVAGVDGVEAALDKIITYHDSCSGLRELGIEKQPRKLLKSVKGLQLSEMEERTSCCGFGGAFSIKYPDISGVITEAKAVNVEQTGADMLLGGDLGCLMNIARKLRRTGSKISVRHVAEVLAGDLDEPPISGDDDFG